MSLSKPSLETLLDLVEIKLGCLEVSDREDARELRVLRRCRDELLSLSVGRARSTEGTGKAVVPLASRHGAPGRGMSGNGFARSA